MTIVVEVDKDVQVSHSATDDDDEVFSNTSQQEEVLIRGPKRNVSILGTLDGLLAVAVFHTTFIFPTLACEVLKDNPSPNLRSHHALNVIIPFYVIVPVTIALAILFRFQAYRSNVCTSWSFLREMEIKQTRNPLLDLLSGVDFLEQEEDEERIRHGSTPILLTAYRIFLLDLAAACGLLIGSLTAAISTWFYYHYPRCSSVYIGKEYDTHINFVAMHNVKWFLTTSSVIAIIWILIAWRLNNFSRCKSKIQIRKIVQWFLLSVLLQFVLIFSLAVHVAFVLNTLRNPHSFLIGIVISTWVAGISVRMAGVIGSFAIIRRLCQIRKTTDERSVCEALLRHGVFVCRDWWML